MLCSLGCPVSAPTVNHDEFGIRAPRIQDRFLDVSRFIKSRNNDGKVWLRSCPVRHPSPHRFTCVHIREGAEDMKGKPLSSRRSNCFIKHGGGPPLHAIKKIRGLLEPDQPVATVRAWPEHKVVAFQSVKSLVNMLRRQPGDIGSMEDDLLSALPKGPNKGGFHSLAKISGTLL
jgi:hypothetical protein